MKRITGAALVALLCGVCAAGAATPKVAKVGLGQTAPQQVALAKDGTLWTNGDLHGLARRTGARITHVSTGEDAVTDLVVGPDGAVWFSSYGRVGRIGADGKVRRWPAESAAAIAASEDGLWFTSEGGPGHVVRLGTDGSRKPFVLAPPRRLFSMPGIAAGPDGTAWFTQVGFGIDKTADAIGHVTAGGHVTSFPLRMRRAAPTRIVAGPDGAMWFTEQNAHAIGRISAGGRITEFPLRTGLSPYGIVAGTDGALWFAANGCLGRITTAGKVAAWRVPGAGRLLGIAAAKDGSFWLADDLRNALWHVRPPAGDTTSTCSPPSVTRGRGGVRATLVYRRVQGDSWYTDARVRIDRGGRRVFSESVPAAEGFDLYGDTSGFAVRDLDGDGEREVLLGLNSNGAHCCSFTRVYRWVAARGTYRPVMRFWGNAGSAPGIRDLDGDRRPEFLSTDDRFAYDFDGYAGSLRPIQILAYDHGKFRDVTRRYPRYVRQDAADAWRQYLQYRGKESVRGILPAWAADQYLLGRGERVWPVLDEALRKGWLKGPVCTSYEPCGAAYVKAVRALLRRLGYIRP